MIVNPATLFPLEFIGQTGTSKPCLLPPKGVCVLSFPRYAKDADEQETSAGWYFPELNLALLPNKPRNGFVNRLCSTEVTKIELKGFFDSLFTSLDGERWEQRNASGEVKASWSMIDPRFGLLYELARMAYGGFSYMDRFLAEYKRWEEESRSKEEPNAVPQPCLEIPQKVSVCISNELFLEATKEADFLGLTMDELSELAIKTFITAGSENL